MKSHEETRLPLPKAFPYIAVGFTLVMILASLKPVITETTFLRGTIVKCTMAVTARARLRIGGYLAGLDLETGGKTQIWLQDCQEGESVRIETTTGFWPFGQKYKAADT